MNRATRSLVYNDSLIHSIVAELGLGLGQVLEKRKVESAGYLPFADGSHRNRTLTSSSTQSSSLLVPPSLFSWEANDKRVAEAGYVVDIEYEGYIAGL